MEKAVVFQVLQACLRYLLAGLATWLIGHGIIDVELGARFADETAGMLLGVLIAGSLVVWAWIRKKTEMYFKRNLAIAGSNPNVTTPEGVVAVATKLQAAGNKPGAIEGETVVTPTGGIAKTTLTLLLAIGLVTNAGCGAGSSPNLTPVQVAAETASYATDAVQLVDSVVKTVSAYAVAQGGRTAETDRLVGAVEVKLLPRGHELARVLRLMTAAQTPDLKNATQAEIKKALDAYETAFEEVLGPGNIPPGMTNTLATSVTNIRDLIKNIRVTFRFAEV